MKNLVILGAGTAGTMAANQLVRRVDPDTWRITVVEREDWHLYQLHFVLRRRAYETTRAMVIAGVLIGLGC